MQIGIDLGTDSILCWAKDEIIIREPCLLAQDVDSGRLLACGTAAWALQGRVGSDVALIHPVVQGRLAHPEAAAGLVKELLGERLGWRWYLRPSLCLAVADNPDSFASQALVGALRPARSRLVPRTLAAARGAGLPVHLAKGQCIVELGAGCSEVAVLSLNQVVVGRTLPVAGQQLDEAISAAVRSQHGLVLSDSQAKLLKHRLAGAEDSLMIWGKDQSSGLPREVEIKAELVNGALAEPLTRLAHGIQKALEQAPPGLACDLVEQGLVLSGGTARLRGLDRSLANHLGLPVRLAADPQVCVAAGAAAETPQSGTGLWLPLWRKSLRLRPEATVSRDPQIKGH